MARGRKRYAKSWTSRIKPKPDVRDTERGISIIRGISTQLGNETIHPTIDVGNISSTSPVIAASPLRGIVSSYVPIVNPDEGASLNFV